MIDEYKPENTNWSNILDHYGDGGTVVHITRAVAIDQQLQYGVGMLSMSLSGKDTSLLWGCPLTGVIVGDQNDVDFEFQPILSTDGCRYVYDPVSVDLTLGDLSPTKPSVPILLLPTVERDSVHFASRMSVLCCRNPQSDAKLDLFSFGAADLVESFLSGSNDDSLCYDFKLDQCLQYRSRPI